MDHKSIGSTELSLEEFSITELEDRLEFLAKCNININKPAQPAPTT
jgi:hypothetical protein